MITFKDLLGCELYKINRKNTLLKLGIALVVIVIAMTALCAIIKGVLGDYLYVETGNAEEAAEMLRHEIAAAEASQTWLNKLLPETSIYALKSQLAVYEYIVDSGIAVGSVTTFSVGGNFLSFNYYDFTETCMSVVMTVVTIFAVVACCRTTTGEYASGALKMQFIRPINKSKFFTAKWLSVFLISEIYLIISFIISFLLGVIVFGTGAPNVLLVLQASKVASTTAFGALTLGMFFKTVTLFMSVQVTMFLCSLCKSNSKALVLSLLLVVFGIGEIIEEILALGYVGFVGFFSNLNWASALTLEGPVFKGMSLFTMIPFTLVWGAIFAYLSYRRFNKLEV